MRINPNPTANSCRWIATAPCSRTSCSSVVTRGRIAEEFCPISAILLFKRIHLDTLIPRSPSKRTLHKVFQTYMSIHLSSCCVPYNMGRICIGHFKPLSASDYTIRSFSLLIWTTSLSILFPTGLQTKAASVHELFA